MLTAKKLLAGAFTAVLAVAALAAASARELRVADTHPAVRRIQAIE